MNSEKNGYKRRQARGESYRATDPIRDPMLPKPMIPITSPDKGL